MPLRRKLRLRWNFSSGSQKPGEIWNFRWVPGYVPVKKEANEMTFVEQAMDAAGASSKMRAIITNAIGMTGENQMYTTKAFRNGTAARAILNDSMVEKARADREAFLALTAEGMPHEEAAAQFVTDENFEAWYEETRTALEMCIAG